MITWPDYELLDFGDGRKLERFGNLRVDRPCPPAQGVSKAKPELWRTVAARYQGDRVGGGQWANKAEQVVHQQELICRLTEESQFRLGVGPSPAGQVGVFPEQCPNWRWIHQQASRRAGDTINVLNLFAYTGASTLAASAAGASVTHVDAAKQSVQAARQNAERSGFAERPIRWIIEDAMRFCQREERRGKRYNAVILDPPSYGHGPKGEAWSIKRDLLPLLTLCGELTDRRPAFMLVTCHTPGIGPAELSAYLCDGVFGSCGQPPRSGELHLETADGRQLPSGVFARWPN